MIKCQVCKQVEYITKVFLYLQDQQKSNHVKGQFYIDCPKLYNSHNLKTIKSITFLCGDNILKTAHNFLVFLFFIVFLFAHYLFSIHHVKLWVVFTHFNKTFKKSSSFLANINLSKCTSKLKEAIFALPYL